MPEENDEPTYRPRATKRGFQYNGWTISWPVIFAGVAIIGNAAVVQYRVDSLENRVDLTAEEARKVRVIDNRITNNESTISYHRLYEHGFDEGIDREPRIRRRP